jgi:hypothetical protein
MTKNEIIHEYWKDDRKAIVRLTEEGFEVDLFKNDTLMETRKVHDHSESYAEDVAENYTDGLFTIDDPNPNSVGYYGFNEKTDNFYPDIDD